MNKDEKKMIKEMANEIDLAKKHLWNAINLKIDDYSWHSKGIAEALYNAGYRKIADDEIVIKKSKINALKNRNDRLKMELKICERKLEKAKQETAREILQELYNECVYFTQGRIAIEKLAQKYGIELE